jgi:hypothetical protein
LSRRRDLAGPPRRALLPLQSERRPLRWVQRRLALFYAVIGDILNYRRTE